MSQIILASASPRRKELLEQVGVEFEVCPAKGEEIITKTQPKDVVMELARQKAKEVAAMISTYGELHPDTTTPQDLLVIGADTVVSYQEHILGKPKDEEDAKQMLTMLSGQTHEVYTGVALLFVEPSGRAGVHTFYEKTEVTMYPMSEKEIQRYIATGDPMDKAGSYGIQGACAIHIKEIHGDYNNVVGLPVARLYQELQNLGFDWYHMI